ncbi:MAG: hypothetical protein WDM77_08695 [Steroidobacteraceae bacterium]
MRGIYDTQGGYGTMKFLEGLLDLEDVRLRDMDANGVDMQLLFPDRSRRADVRCGHRL